MTFKNIFLVLKVQWDFSCSLLFQCLYWLSAAGFVLPDEPKRCIQIRAVADIRVLEYSLGLGGIRVPFHLLRYLQCLVMVTNLWLDSCCLEEGLNRRSTVVKFLSKQLHTLSYNCSKSPSAYCFCCHDSFTTY